MRRRRAERCILRAEVALDAGFEAEARTALEEARRLDWQSPDFESLKARLANRRAADAAERNRRRRRVYAAAAVLGVAVAGGALFLSDDPAPLPRGADVAIASPAQPPAETPASSLQEPPAPSEPPAPTPQVLAPEANTAGTSEPRGEVERTSTTEPRPQADPQSRARSLDRPAEPPREERPATAARSQDVRNTPVQSVPTTPGVSELPQKATALLGRTEPPAFTPPPAARVPDLPPAPVTTPPTTPRAAAPPATLDDSGVRAALARFESAYSSLNADAAHAVWPGVDASALARAFDSLKSQRVTLGRCSISMNGASARASCQGSTTWTPKVGGGGTQSAARRWDFELANSGGSWQIAQVNIR